ncbi:MAG: hypothetical protein AAFQ43_14710 [Bacteroidota bacterium]
MLRACLLALLLAPLAAAQPLATAEPLTHATQVVAEIPVDLAAPEAERLRVALVVQQAEDDGGCGDGIDCSDSSGGGDCGSDGDLDTAACVALGGCAVLTAGAGYGLWRLIKRRRGPKEDTLGAASPIVEALARGLAPHVEIVAASPEADVT